MKKRWLLLVPLGLILVITIAFLFLRRAYPPERLLALVEPRVESALGRDVEIASAQLTPFPLALRLDDVRIQAAPGFATPDLVTLASLRFDLKLGPLLQRRIAVRSLVIESPRVFLEQNMEGRWNYELSKAAQEDAAAPESAAPGAAAVAPLGLAVETLQLRDGELHVWNAQQDLALELPFAGKWSVRTDRNLRDIRVEGWLESDALSGGDRGRLARVQGVRLRLEPRLRADVADSSAVIEALHVELQGLALDLAGKGAIRGGAPQLQLQTRSNEFDLAELLSLVPQGLAPQIETLRAAGRGRLALEIDLPAGGEAGLSGRLSISDGSIESEEWPAIGGLQADLDYAGDFLMISKLEAKVAGSPIRIEGRVHEPLDRDQAALDLNLQAAVDLGQALRLFESPDDLELSGNVGASLRVQGSPYSGALPHLQGPITLESVRIRTAQLAQPLGLHARLEARGDQVEIASATLDAGGSKVTLEGTLHAALTPDLARLELRARAGTLDLDPLLAAADADAAAGEDAAAAPPTRQTATPPLLPLRMQAMLQADAIHARGAALGEARVELDAGPEEIDARLTAATFDRDKLHLKTLRARVQGQPTRATGRLQAARGKLAKLELSELESDVRVAGTRIELTNLRARAYQGRVVGEVAIDLAEPDTPQQELEIEVEEVQLGGLLGDVTTAGSLVHGSLSGTSSWSSRGVDAAAIRRNLTAEGQGVALNGTLRDTPLLVALGDILKLTSLRDFNYRELGFKFEVESGRVRFPRLQLRGSDANLAFLGSVGLDGALDLDLNVQLSDELSRHYLKQRGGSTLGSIFADEQGRVVLDFDVGGSVKAPRLRPNLQRTASRGLKSIEDLDLGKLLGEVAEDPKSAETIVGDQLKDALGGLLGSKKRAAPDSTRKP
ncbi:MAG: AsmA family protein [Candidatus Latescibacterota bacterium]|nr:MAG: AsmA family protein [Candidatus Latescibacterota bacterium]